MNTTNNIQRRVYGWLAAMWVLVMVALYIVVPGPNKIYAGIGMAIGLSPFWAPWVWKRIWPREYHAVAVMAILMVAIGLLIPTFISPFQFLWIIKAIGALVSIGLMFFGIVLYRDCFRLPV